MEAFRAVSSRMSTSEHTLENKLRPLSFEDFPGQDEVKEKLKVFIKASILRSEPLDHVLLSGPPGLGKTTLAKILALSMAAEFRATSAPAIDKKGDLAAILTSLAPNSVLFIDEIHRLSRAVEEYLYSAMEDFHIDIVAGEGLGATSMRFPVPPFTLVGATTRAGMLNAPFRDRFGIQERLNFYDKESLQKIVLRSSGLLSASIDSEAALEVATRSRGTPRIANRLLKRVRDYAQVAGLDTIDLRITKYALDQLGVDPMGLDGMDRRFLAFLGDQLEGQAVGIETISAALSEERETLEEVYEPYLLQEGFIKKTSRGRVITHYGLKHIGKTPVQLSLE